MDNTLTKIESEEFIILREETYNVYERKKYIDYFEKLVKEGKIQGQYEDKIWMCYSGIRYFGINFDFSNMEYKRHFGKELDIEEYGSRYDKELCIAHMWRFYIQHNSTKGKWDKRCLDEIW